MQVPIVEKMIVLDWYDGPAGGLLQFNGSEIVYGFETIEMDLHDSKRVLGLFDSYTDLTQVIDHLCLGNASWPIWFPRELVNPTDRTRVLLESFEKKLGSSLMSDVAIFDTKRNLFTTCLVGISSEMAIHAKPLFSLEEIEMDMDWFRFIDTELQRNLLQ